LKAIGLMGRTIGLIGRMARTMGPKLVARWA
jgi:hypothetical protein